MKALSLWGTWAQLIAVGVKTIETRSWSTSHRGPLAIATTKGMTLGVDNVRARGGFRIGNYYAFGDGCGEYWLRDERADGAIHPIPLGAVVATCELVDVVPIMAPGPHSFRCIETFDSGSLYILEPRPDDDIDGLVTDVTDQRPYGLFAGRFAWILADVKALDPPVPAKGRQQLWEWDEKGAP